MSNAWIDAQERSREWPVVYKAGKDLPTDSVWGDHHRIVVTAGLRKLEGNARPYFSVTAEIVNKRGGSAVEGAGAMHDEILAHWPELAPVVALHLSDDEGVPMHAVANARYWLGLTEFKRGTVRLAPDQGTTEVALPHLPYVANHLRISETEAAGLAARYPADRAADTSGLDDEINAMRPRWKQEADEAVTLLREFASR